MLRAKPPVKEILQDAVRVIEENGRRLVLIGPVQMPVQLDGRTVMFQWYSWLSGSDLPRDLDGLLEALPTLGLAERQQSSVLVYGDLAESEEAVIRMHSICQTGDIFGSRRCDCGSQFQQSMKLIVESGCGALFYLADHEGRGIGLLGKAMAYLLQEQGYDTVEANTEPGFADDARSYEEAVLVLRTLRQKPVTLLTNNPRKLQALRRAGMGGTKHVHLWSDVSPFNRRYIQTKVYKSGHLMREEEQRVLFQVEP
jgi:GTP cyclohydrolase II